MPAEGVKLFFSGPATDAKFSSDGSTMFVTNSQLVRAVDVASGTVLATYRLGETAGALSVSPDGSKLVVVGKNTIYEGDTETVSIFAIDLTKDQITKHEFDVTSEVPDTFFDVAYLASGDVLASFESNSPLALFDPETGSLSSAGTDAIGGNVNLIESADGTKVYVVGHDAADTRHIYTDGAGVTATLAETGDPYSGAGLPPSIAGAGAIADDGGTVFVNNGTAIYDAALELLQDLDLPVLSVLGADIDEVNNRLFVAPNGGAILEIDLATGETIATYELGVDVKTDYRHGYGNALQVDASGKYLLVNTVDGIALVDLSVFAPRAGGGEDVITEGSVIYGTPGDDVLGGDEPGQQMYGLGGDDTYLIYQNGDWAYEEPGEGHDNVRTTLGLFMLEPNIEDLFYEGTANARLQGNALDNLIVGGPGNDYIEGAYGNDTLDGKGGFNFAIYLYDNFAETGSTVDLAIAGPQDTGRTGIDTLINIHGVRGNNAADHFMGDGGDNRLMGEGGDDLLEGRGGNDRLDGGSGDDLLIGGPGDDRLDGDEGFDTASYVDAPGAVTVNLNLTRAQDTVSAGIDQITDVENLIGSIYGDTLFGSSGTNTIDGGRGSDTLRGLAGDDEIFGGLGHDAVFGGTENDTLQGDGGNDRVYGNAGDDFVNGGVGNDNVFGGGGNDQVHGGNGQDIMNGHAGDDMLVGGPGNDLIVGGQGADRFLFNEGHLGSGSSATDRIKDFNSDQGDVIDFKNIDADTTTAGDQAFEWIGNAAFSGSAGELRTEIVGNTTYVYGDTNGDGHANIALLFTGQVTLAEGDFIL